jgi:hypothetical protein
MTKMALSYLSDWLLAIFSFSTAVLLNSGKLEFMAI